MVSNLLSCEQFLRLAWKLSPLWSQVRVRCGKNSRNGKEHRESMMMGAQEGTVQTSNDQRNYVRMPTVNNILIYNII